jgi:hypothetical protein
LQFFSRAKVSHHGHSDIIRDSRDQRRGPLPILGKRSCRVMHCASAAFAAGAVKRGFDMVMLTSDLSCMIAGARMQLDEFKAKTA